MKKILALALVVSLVSASVFAGVSFSGSATAGFQFNYDEENWETHLYGDDGDDTDTASVNLSIADDNGLWTVLLEGTPALDSSGSLAGDVTVDFGKMIFGADSPFSLTAGMAANDRSTTLRAYTNQSGKSFDRVRTADNGYFATLGFAYGDLVQVQTALAPKLTGSKTVQKADLTTGVVSEVKETDTIYRGDFTASALVTPVDGIAVSVDYVLNGEDDQDNGIFGAAADINIGKLLGTDFTAGVSVADRYNFEKGNDFAVTVYGGIDLIEVAVEYAYTKDEAHSLYAGIDLNLIDNLGIGLYTGADDVTDYENTYYVGTDLSYTYTNITFGFGLEYAEAAAGFNYDNGGLNIVPYVSVAW